MEKVHQTIVWHEFGHIFGYVLIDKAFDDYRKISKIILIENDIPQIVPNKESSNLVDNEKIEVIKVVLIFVMGAIFHVAKFKRNDEILLRDFKDIFINAQYNLSTNNLIGHAGSDFCKIKKFIDQSNYFAKNSKLIANGHLKVKKFSFYMLSLFKENDLFSKLEPYIDDFDYRYNGKKIEGNDLYKNEKNEIKKIITVKLVKELKGLINIWFSTDI